MEGYRTLEGLSRSRSVEAAVAPRASIGCIATPLEKLNFELAYKRARDELVDQRRSGRAFVAAPFEQELVEHDLESWLEELRTSVLERSFTSHDVEVCGSPKGADLVRPGIRMSLADRVVYTAAVGGCVRHIIAATRWSQRRVDFMPLFHATKSHTRHWLLKPYVGWSGWTEESLAKLGRARTKYVVTADIAGYFENISISRLLSELARVGCPTDTVELIGRCLLRWTLVRDRGLPQGVLASDVLAKLYLESFDKRLKDDGYTHVRYADDIRVFCRSLPESRRALVLLTELLRERGLTVQSAKTRIRVANDDLAREFEGAVPLIKALHRQYIDEALAAGVLTADEASVPASVIDDLVNAEPDSMNPEVFHRAFERFVIERPAPNPTMFRYLLRRFAGSLDHYAVEYCSEHLSRRPEIAPEVLRYFEDLDAPGALEVPLRKALSHRELAMYPFSRFLILSWLHRHGSSRARTLKAVRGQAFGFESPDYVRAAARRVLGRLGDDSDLDKMAVLLASSREPLERAQLLCCLYRLEKGRRNALAGRLRTERPWGARAAAYVKTQ